MPATDRRAGGAVIVRGDWLVQSPRCVIPEGEVRFQDGRVTDAGREVARAFPGDPVLSFPGCVILPGLINAHTHLELTLLRGMGRGLPFARWLEKVAREVLGRDREFFEQSARMGVREQIRGGVTTLADHSAAGVSHTAIRDAGVSGVVYREVFCLDPEAAHTPALDFLASELERMTQESGADVRIGLSCHAPYNACPPALDAVVSRFKGVPRSIHVAESPEESAFIRSGEGALAGQRRERGIAVRAHRMSPVEYLDNRSYWHPGSQAVHLTQASQGDLAVLAARGVCAAFCPVSNAVLGVGIPPVRAARVAGLLCGLGTDSAISSERQDLFEEMRMAVMGSRLRSAPVTEQEVFAMATSEGAASLGWRDRGMLEPGSRADAVALRLTDTVPGEGQPEDIISAIVWQGSACQVEAVWSAGRMIWNANGEDPQGWNG
jgi:5-methylthioadenosine/S-adenosylhomocysteine deaminase